MTPTSNLRATNLTSIWRKIASSYLLGWHVYNSSILYENLVPINPERSSKYTRKPNTPYQSGNPQNYNYPNLKPHPLPLTNPNINKATISQISSSSIRYLNNVSEGISHYKRIIG